MARLTDALLNDGIANGVSKAYGRGRTQPMLDLQLGGQFGWSNNLSQWVSNQAYVRRNLVCILLEAPKFFQLMPEPQKWVDSLKSLFELHARSIEGYNAGLTATFDEHAVGGAGEVQHEITNMVREQSKPTFTFVEKYGLPIFNFLHSWMQYGMMDPDTKYAMVGTLAGDRPSDMLADWYTATILVFEPDPTHRKVVKAWVTTNVMPTTTGDYIGKRDLTTASELSELSIEFTGLSQTGQGVTAFAQSILDNISIENAVPTLRPSFIQSINADVSASQEGYEKNAEDLGSTAVGATSGTSGSGGGVFAPTATPSGSAATAAGSTTA
jgi:hypothetical protein